MLEGVPLLLMARTTVPPLTGGTVVYARNQLQFFIQKGVWTRRSQVTQEGMPWSRTTAAGFPGRNVDLYARPTSSGIAGRAWRGW